MKLNMNKQTKSKPVRVTFKREGAYLYCRQHGEDIAMINFIDGKWRWRCAYNSNVTWIEAGVAYAIADKCEELNGPATTKTK